MEKTVEELEKELADTKAKAEENVKALQQKLTINDEATKKLQGELEELKKAKETPGKNEEIENLTKKIEEMTEQIGNLNTEKAKERLQAKYPDIVPELLLGRNEEEIELIVKKQREMTEKNYDRKPSVHEPKYTERSDFDKAVQDVKEDRSLDTDQKLQKVRELKLKRDF